MDKGITYSPLAVAAAEARAASVANPVGPVIETVPVPGEILDKASEFAQGLWEEMFEAEPDIEKIRSGLMDLWLLYHVLSRSTHIDARNIGWFREKLSAHN